MKQQIQTANAPQPKGPYSQGIKIGQTIYVAGQGPLDVESGEIVEGTIEEQTRLVFSHLEAILKEAGAKLDDVVKVTAHLSDLVYFQDFNKVYGEYFQAPFPVRTTVGSQLPPNMKVEIDVVAIVSE